MPGWVGIIQHGVAPWEKREEGISTPCTLNPSIGIWSTTLLFEPGTDVIYISQEQWPVRMDVESVVRCEEIPSDLTDALIVILFKKGDKADCGNYRGISLLITILFKRFLPLSEEVLPETVWLPSRLWHNWHDLHNQTATRKMQGTKTITIYGLHRSYKSLRFSQALWTILCKCGCPE